jgi:NADH-quinone oxidoreductase subunit M
VRRLCQGSSEHTARQDVTAIELGAWVPLVALTILLGLYPKAILAITDPAVQLLVGKG